MNRSKSFQEPEEKNDLRAEFVAHVGQKIGLELDSTALVINVNSDSQPLQDVPPLRIGLDG